MANPGVQKCHCALAPHDQKLEARKRFFLHFTFCAYEFLMAKLM